MLPESVGIRSDQPVGGGPGDRSGPEDGPQVSVGTGSGDPAAPVAERTVEGEGEDDGYGSAVAGAAQSPLEAAFALDVGRGLRVLYEAPRGGAGVGGPDTGYPGGTGPGGPDA